MQDDPATSIGEQERIAYKNSGKFPCREDTLWKARQRPGRQNIATSGWTTPAGPGAKRVHVYSQVEAAPPGWCDNFS